MTAWLRARTNGAEALQTAGWETAATVEEASGSIPGITDDALTHALKEPHYSC